MKNILFNLYLLFHLTITDSFIFKHNFIFTNKPSNLNLIDKSKLDLINVANEIKLNIGNDSNITELPKYYRFGINPTLQAPNQNGVLTWYIAGLPKDFKINKSVKVTIRDINYIVWRDINNKYYGLRDVCSHQGSSFQGGCVLHNTITCPYHGYVFNGDDGHLTDIPKMQFVDSDIHNIDSFKVIEKDGFVFINTVPLSNNGHIINENLIWSEPEASNPEQTAIILSKEFEHNAKFVSVNSLDICHIGFVHTFGNRQNPNPVNNTKVFKMNDSNFHYKIIYEYLAGSNSLVNKYYKFNKITVENEYVLPHTTVARVLFGNFTSTIITNAVPISKFKSKLYVKAYRNYWYINKETANPFILPFASIINYIGDKFTEYTMEVTLNQDKAIVDNIDKTDYKLMHGKFSILYDVMSNHYKNNYKTYYEYDKNSF